MGRYDNEILSLPYNIKIGLLRLIQNIEGAKSLASNKDLIKLTSHMSDSSGYDDDTALEKMKKWKVIDFDDYYEGLKVNDDSLNQLYKLLTQNLDNNAGINKEAITLLGKKNIFLNRGKKNIRLRKLYALFSKKRAATFRQIAVEISLCKTQADYKSDHKAVIINLQKNFNKHLRNENFFLKASNDRLELISTNRHQK